jgi:uncharacterized protein
MVEQSESEMLERRVCLLLLAASSLGRVVLTVQALPAVQPVNCVIDRELVLFRTAAGSRFDHALLDTVVAFEVDNLGVAGERWWSVTVLGRSEIVTDPAENYRLTGLALPAWPTDEQAHFVLIRLDFIQGWCRMHRFGCGPERPRTH